MMMLGTRCLRMARGRAMQAPIAQALKDQNALSRVKAALRHCVIPPVSCTDALPLERGCTALKLSGLGLGRRT